MFDVKNPKDGDRIEPKETLYIEIKKGTTVSAVAGGIAIMKQNLETGRVEATIALNHHPADKEIAEHYEVISFHEEEKNTFKMRIRKDNDFNYPRIFCSPDELMP